MTRTAWRLLCLLALLLGALAASLVWNERPVQAKPALTLDIAPLVGLAPLDVRIRIRVDRHERNRGLFVQASSLTFHRSSFVQLDGVDAPAYYEIYYKGVPCGDYVFSVDLLDDQGKVWMRVDKPAVYHGILCEEPPPPPPSVDTLSA